MFIALLFVLFPTLPNHFLKTKLFLTRMKLGVDRCPSLLRFYW